MTIKLYDTLSRTVKELKPLDGKKYRFYCCGPTVYGPAHIGNFRTFLVQDVFRRVLGLEGEQEGWAPYYVRNLTDVDDKTIRGSQAQKVSLTEFTEKWTKKFHEDCEALNMIKPDEEPTATGHIPEQIEMIQTLIDKGHAYVAKDGSVYYKVNTFKYYGKLAHLDQSHLQTQSENSAGNANLADEYDRESVADFSLWKAHKDEDGPNAWDSPWGKGRPGWHIECSAMSKKYLGETFDLHAGGIDLCFPHHENEIAQSEGASGKPFAMHWFHSAHLQVEGAKMSKSLGNLYTLDDIRNKGHNPMVARYLLISGHYRHPLNFTMDGLSAATSALNKLEKFARFLLEKANLDEASFEVFAKDVQYADWASFESAWKELCDDLNIPSALGEVFKTIKELENKELSAIEAKKELKGFSKIMYALGLKLFTEVKKEAPKEIYELAKKRWEAKNSKDFANADRLRVEIETKGWKILDHKEGFELEVLKK
ncbi:MAG: cysteine--tRNA ligase [Verrucomicrobia bacterium]|nr:MAG: cysteine--tRNA ligase [Verrucomicrobiota bacterium]